MDLEDFIGLCAIVFWIIGAATVAGWAMFFAIIFPPAAWVFAAQYFMGLGGC